MQVMLRLPIPLLPLIGQGNVLGLAGHQTSKLTMTLYNFFCVTLPSPSLSTCQIAVVSLL